MTETVAVPLYLRTEALQIVDAWIAENEDAIAAGEGELPPELLALLETAEREFDEKAANVGRYIHSLGVTGETIKAEESRLARKRKAVENVQTKLKAYLLEQMLRVGKTKVKQPFATLSVIGTTRVECLMDQAALRNMAQGYPGTVKIIPETAEPVRAEIKKVLEAKGVEELTMDGGTVKLVHDHYVRIS